MDMDSVKIYINLLFSLVATNIVAALGGWNISLRFLVLLIALDYLTGVSRALSQKGDGLWGTKLSNTIGGWGILKKLGIFIVVACAVQLDLIISPSTPVTKTITIYFYISNEGISMLENLTALGVRIPDVIKDKLSKIGSVEKKEEV